MASLIPKNKTLFIIIAVGLFLVEVEIFAIAVMKSGDRSMLQVADNGGTVVYEIRGKHISAGERQQFENLFGPIQNYRVKLLRQEVPFPFREWFVAAIGIPIGSFLLFAFLVTAYNALFAGGAQGPRVSEVENQEEAYTSKLERILHRISRLNIFAIGFLIFLLVFLYWVVPNLLTYIGSIGMKTLLAYKWFFLVLAVVGLGLFAWIVYLRYLLARKSIEARTELEKARLALACNGSLETQMRALQIGYSHTGVVGTKQAPIERNPENDMDRSKS